MLILDSKTRWNSLVDMIKRFAKLKKSIKMSLIELSSDIHFSDEEFNELEDLIAALEPVKIGTKALCRWDATFISADEVKKFIYQQLNMQTSSFSKELLALFIKRMNQRRNLEVMALLLYLNNPNVIESQSPDVFGIPQVKQPNLAKKVPIFFADCLKKTAILKRTIRICPTMKWNRRRSTI